MKTIHNFLQFPAKLGLMACLTALVLLTGCKKDDDTDKNLVAFSNIALSGANEVPPVSPAGSGMFNGTYNRATKVLNYTVTWSLSDPMAQTRNMHFHGPAEVTEFASPRLPITGFPTGSANQTFTSSTVPLDATQEEELLNGKWYINIHSSTHPGGELRGQLIRR